MQSRIEAKLNDSSKLLAKISFLSNSFLCSDRAIIVPVKFGDDAVQSVMMLCDDKIEVCSTKLEENLTDTGRSGDEFISNRVGVSTTVH